MEHDKLELKFAPGCFDDFDGTQEELAELIAQIRQMVEDGSIFEQSEPVPEDEAELIMKRVEQRQSRQ